MTITASSNPVRAVRRARVAIAAAAAASLLVLSACSSSDDDSIPEPGASTPASGSSGGVLRVGIASLSEADALDPASASTTGGYVIASQLYDTLTAYDTDGAWQPSLAASVEPGDSADEWTITLRDDAQWSDGRPVTADDVIATVSRWFDDQLPPSQSMSYIDPTAITKEDDLTVTFQLTDPVVTFPEALASPTTAIVPVDFDPQSPVGSGPFVLATHAPGIQITFETNKDYWGTVAEYDELNLISFADASTEVTALLAGQIDVAANVDPTLVSQIESADGYGVFSYGTSGALSWAMNTEQEPFDDPVVRQALRLAVDRDALVQQVYNGYATIGNDIWSPYDPLYSDSLPQRAYDPEGAREMLEDAGYALPVEVELWGTNNTPTSDRQNQALVQMAADAGFDIEFQSVDSATFYGDAYGTYPLSLSYWGYLGIFDQAAFTITETAPYNSTHWINEEYDRLYDEAIQTVDDTERKALVEQMQTIEYESGSYVVPVFLNTIVGHSDAVTGFAAYPNTDGAIGYNFNILSID